MQTQRERGSYARGEVVRIMGSFKTNGSSAPDTIRDGHCFVVKSVARTSAGLYTVTLDPDTVVPELPIKMHAHLESSATPTIIAQANIVSGSYDKTAKTFQIVVYNTSGTPGVGDPDAGARINFEIAGSLNSAGTDLA